jgi:hypothetical protein
MRGLVCDDKILGPKTEGKKHQIWDGDFDISPIPRTISFPDDDPLTDREHFILREYVLNGGPPWVFLSVRSEIPKGATSLAFQRNSKSVQFALMLIAELWVSQDIPSDPTMTLVYRNKSYAALRRAIDNHSYLEITFACHLLIRYDTTLDRQAIHLSGMWEAIKCLRRGSSKVSTEDRSFPVLNLFLSSLAYFSFNFGFVVLAHLPASEAWTPSDVESLSGVLRLALEFLRNGFFEFGSSGAYNPQDVRFAYALCLEVYFYRQMHPPPFHHPFSDDDIKLLLEAAQALTAHELQTDVEIRNLLHSVDLLEYNQFPAEIPISPNVSWRTARHALSHFTRNTVLYILAYDSRVDWGKLLLDCLKLVSLASAVSCRSNYLAPDIVLNAFFLGGLFLTKSRHPTGTRILGRHTNKVLANAWIKGKIGENIFRRLCYSKIRAKLLPFLDLADKCETVSEVLSLSFQDYSVWQCLLTYWWWLP